METPTAKTTGPTLMLAPDDILLGDPDIIQLLRQESERRKRANKTFTVICWVCITLLAAGEIWHWARTGKLDMGFLVPLMLIAGGVVVGVNKTLASAIKGAAPLRDPRSLGPMLEVLDAKNEELSAVATDCIVDLLPQLDESSWAGLSLDHKRRLAQMLKTSTNAKSALTLAAAHARFGDIETVGVLEAFCGGTTGLTGSDRDRVVGQARMELADLRMRLAKARIDAEIETLDHRTLDA